MPTPRIAAVFCILLLAPTLCADPPTPGPTLISSQPLCRLPANRTANFHLITNPDMSKLASIDTWKNDAGATRWYLALNSELWEFYTNLDPASPRFDSAGNHLYLLAEHDHAWFLIKDNADFRPLGPDPCHHLLLTRDAQHDACIRTLPDHHQQILLDGKPVALSTAPANAATPLPPTFDEIQSLSFNPDTNQLTFLARRDHKTYLILSGTLAAIADADQISPLWLSDDAKHAGWGLCVDQPTGRTVIAMLDDKPTHTYPIPPKTLVLGFAVSENAESILWALMDDNGLAYAIDGRLTRLDKTATIRRIAISRDGQHVAYLGKHLPSESNEMLVIDGEIVRLSLRPGAGIEFTPDSKSIHTTGSADHLNIDLINGIWFPKSYPYISPDGRLRISGGFSTFQVNESLMFEGDFLTATIDGQSAYILAESPRTLKIENQLTDVARIFLALPTTAK